MHGIVWRVIIDSSGFSPKYIHPCNINASNVCAKKTKQDSKLGIKGVILLGDFSRYTSHFGQSYHSLE